MSPSCKRLKIVASSNTQKVAPNFLLKLASWALPALIATTTAFAQQTISILDPAPEVNEIKAAPGMITENPKGAQGNANLRKAFQWNQEKIIIENEGPLHYVHLHAIVDDPISEVQLNGHSVPIQADGTIEMQLGYHQSTKTFEITWFDSKQNFYRTHFTVQEAPNPNQPIAEKPHPNKTRYSLGVGFTQIKYTQTDLPEFTEKAITIKGGINQVLSPRRWDLNIGAFYNASAYGSTSAYKIQYLGINLKLSYHLIQDASPFQVNLSAGTYYNTSFGSIGFKDVYGPELFPEMSYLFSNRHMIFGYAKYAPVISNGKFDFSQNKEIAMGAHYSVPVSKNNRISFGADYSQLSLTVSGLSAKTSTITGSVGFSF